MLQFFFFFCAFFFALIDAENSSVTPEIASSTTTVEPMKNCPSTWTPFEPTSSCYSLTPYLTWADAEQYCVLQGGHLASIHSQAELDFADGLLNSTTKWIGFNQVDDKTWEWTDGSLVDSTYWFPSFPKRNGGNCASSWQYFINILDCDNFNLIGVCKKPAI